jgi:hypothetical protein
MNWKLEKSPETQTCKCCGTPPPRVPYFTITSGGKYPEAGTREGFTVSGFLREDLAQLMASAPELLEALELIRDNSTDLKVIGIATQAIEAIETKGGANVAS